MKQLPIELLWGLVLTMLTYVLGKFCNPFGTDIFGLSQFYLYYPFFMFGALVRKNNLFNIIFVSHEKIFCFSELCYIALFIVSFFIHFAKTLHVAAPFAIYALVYVFFKYRKSESKIQKILAYLGLHSMEIYVIHYFFLKNCKMHDVGEYIVGNGNHFIELFFSICIAILICFSCILVARLIEENQYLSALLLGKIKFKKKYVGSK